MEMNAHTFSYWKITRDRIRCRHRCLRGKKVQTDEKFEISQHTKVPASKWFLYFSESPQLQKDMLNAFTTAILKIKMK
jgi:hypothetical protein